MPHPALVHSFLCDARADKCTSSRSGTFLPPKLRTYMARFGWL